jgi:bacteriocin biosynthesis cyclodehydratase domain-containing protein
MIRIPKFKNHFRIEACPPDLLFFIHESGYQFVQGKLLCLLAPMIDEIRTIDEIAHELKGKASLMDVQSGLWMLKEDGFLTEAEEGIAKVIESDQLQILDAVDKNGIKADYVVLVDDYLQEGLAEFNQTAIQQNYAWVPAKIRGQILCLGPVFSSDGPCWNCLALRLREKRRVESYLRANPHRLIRNSISQPIDVAEFEAVSRVLKRNPRMLITLDLQSRKLERHSVIRMEHCSVCGNLPMKMNNPIILATSPKFNDPQGTFVKYSSHISFRTGIVDHFETNQDGVIHSAVADHVFVPTIRKKDLLRKGLTQKSWGKGRTLAQARASALCEALERYSGVFRGNEYRILKAFDEIRDQAIPVNDCTNFSDAQFKERERWNRSHSGHDWIPMRMDKKKKIEWTPIWSLTHNMWKYLPTAYCYYGYPLPSDHLFCHADSNGNAAGNSLEEAILNGFLEVVERDCAALWWYNRLQKSAVDFESFSQPYLNRVRRYYERNGRDLWALDIASDFQIPCFAAVSVLKGSGNSGYILGLGAHLDPEIALMRAVTEMNQFFNTKAKRSSFSPDFCLRPAPDSIKTFKDFHSFTAKDFREEVKFCMKIVEQNQMEMLVLGQTRSDVGLPVVKVIVPGMRQIWPRFGPGRLYDIPLKLGWTKTALNEKQLNQHRILI